MVKNTNSGQAWWHTAVISGLSALYESGVSLVYIVNARSVKADSETISPKRKIDKKKKRKKKHSIK